MDQGRQGRDQVDAAVVPDVRGQRRAAPTSCARLQSRQFLADAGDARADQGLVTDKLEGEADQDRRESREPRPLCRLPNGRGRHPTANVPGDFAAHRGTAAAATTSAGARRSMVMHSRATDRRSASKCQGKWPDQTLDQAFGLPEVLVAVNTSRLSCKRAGETRTLMPVWDSFGESRMKRITIIVCGLVSLAASAHAAPVLKLENIKQIVCESTAHYEEDTPNKKTPA